MRARLVRPAPQDALARLFLLYLAKREDHLQLDARRRLFQHVQAYPGLHLAEIARGLDMEKTQAKYHLEYLERKGLVSSRRDDAYWRFFPREESAVGEKEVVLREEKTALALLRQSVPLHITLVLLDREELAHHELLDLVPVAHGTLSYHLGKLERAGLVDARKDGRERRYRLREHDRMLALVLRYKPPDALVQGFLDAWDALGLE